MSSKTHFATRYVDDLGETLVVRDYSGIKRLTDPVNGTIVFVPASRRAKLIEFTFDVDARSCSRDTHVTVIQSNFRLGFVSVRYPLLRIFLQDLCEDQLVDVLPSAEPIVAYAAIPRPTPVLFGAIAAQPIYAHSSYATAAYAA